MPHEYFGWGGMWGFPIMPIIFFILILAALFIVIRGGMMCGPYGSHGNRNKPPEAAMEILKKRYAKGELTKEEFEQMKRDIE